MPKTDDETIAPDDKDIFAAALTDETPPEADEQPKDEQPEDPDAKADADDADDGDETDRQEAARPKAEGEKRKDYRVPSWRLREANEAKEAERMAREAAEQRLRDREAEMERDRREVEEMRRRYSVTNAPKPQPAPDIIENPQGYQQFVQSQVERMVSARLIDASFDDAKETHGGEFDKAWVNLTKEIERGDTLTRDRIVNAPNPGRALMRWHKERQAISEIGTDPDAYKARVKDELRQSLMADPTFREELLKSMRTEASGSADQSRPNTVTRLPPSLNRATGSRSNETEDTTPMSDQELFRHTTRR